MLAGRKGHRQSQNFELRYTIVCEFVYNKHYEHFAQSNAYKDMFKGKDMLRQPFT